MATYDINNNIANAYATGGFGGLFGEIFANGLGAWVQVETAQAQAEASAWAQERTRTATTSQYGDPVPYQSARAPLTAGIGNITGTQAVVIGGVLVAAYLLLK